LTVRRQSFEKFDVARECEQGHLVTPLELLKGFEGRYLDAIHDWGHAAATIDHESDSQWQFIA
jgi:hypothetical protein